MNHSVNIRKAHPLNDDHKFIDKLRTGSECRKGTKEAASSFHIINNNKPILFNDLSTLHFTSAHLFLRDSQSICAHNESQTVN